MIDYEPWLLHCIPDQGEIAIDVGANEGIFSRFLAKRFKIVHAIEANPEVIPALQYDLPANVMIHLFAAWDKNELVRFTKFASSGHSSAYFKNEGLATGPPIDFVDWPGIPLDGLELNGWVNFIKIDVEGAEVQVVRGAERIIREHRPILVIEVHAKDNFIPLATMFFNWHFSIKRIDHPYYDDQNPFKAEHFWLHVFP
jgi:FkbM family methyltransferase